VRQPLLQVVAIMVKRGWFEEAPASFSEFLAYVQHLLENPATRTVGALMMRSLLEEFSSSNRSALRRGAWSGFRGSKTWQAVLVRHGIVASYFSRRRVVRQRRPRIATFHCE
jgi:hypothetical protein